GVLVEVERGEHQHPGPVTGPADVPVRLDAVEPGHSHVHHHDVGGRGSQQFSRGLPVAGLADHGHVVLCVEYHPEPGPHQFLVIDQEDPDAHAAPLGPAVASTTIGATTSGRTAAVPWPSGLPRGSPVDTVRPGVSGSLAVTW